MIVEHVYNHSKINIAKFRFTNLFSAGDQCVSGGDPDCVDDWHRSKGQTVQQHPRQRRGHLSGPGSNGDQTVHRKHWWNCQGQGSRVKVKLFKYISILFWKYTYSLWYLEYNSYVEMSGSFPNQVQYMYLFILVHKVYYVISKVFFLGPLKFKKHIFTSVCQFVDIKSCNPVSIIGEAIGC